MPFSPFAPLDRLIAPPPEADRVAFLGGQPYAHRGLHGGAIVENSRAAFRAAIEGGFGIELDVQAAHGGEPFVFHDATLERLTDATGALWDRVGHELDAIRLQGVTPRLSVTPGGVDRPAPELGRTTRPFTEGCSGSARPP